MREHKGKDQFAYKHNGHSLLCYTGLCCFRNSAKSSFIQADALNWFPVGWKELSLYLAAEVYAGGELGGRRTEMKILSGVGWGEGLDMYAHGGHGSHTCILHLRLSSDK